MARSCLVLALALSRATGSAPQAPQADAPIAGHSLTRLDGVWTARQLDAGGDTLLSMDGQVPGDIITDLQKAGLIGDPLYEMNFRNESLWNDPGTSWEYSRTFHVPAAVGLEHILVFDGVKMGASISIDGTHIGAVTDQFVRYNFSVAPGDHVLAVHFQRDVDTQGRFMACSGGWDWGPYSTAYVDGDHFYTYGIWKSVYYVSLPAAGAAITHVVPHTFFLGDHAVSPLAEGAHAGFQVRARVHLRAGSAGAKGELRVSGTWGAQDSVPVQLASDEERAVEVNLTAAASQIRLWWPLGLGEQPMYSVTASFLGSESSRRMGFRVVALVTGNDTDTAYVEAARHMQGSDSHGLYYRVNGAAILARGSNVIPMDNMEGRLADDAHVQMVKSAAAGNMNVLRVWGGGIFFPDSFYDTADELGILVYHDLMYTTTTKTHEPKGSDAEAEEIRHQVRRLSHHPSIFVWNSCNECSASGLYVSFAMTHVAMEDLSRPIWPGCPSSGWKSGVRRLDSLPTGGPLSSGGDGQIERHGPYANGNGWEAVNMGPAHELLIRDTMLPVALEAGTRHGLGLANKFTSEFGVSVFPSFESFAPTLAENHWSVHGGAPEDDCTKEDSTNGFWKDCQGGNVMAQRNYPCDNLILGYFGEGKAAALDETGEAAFKRQLYQCTLAQALAMKSIIEMYRASNSFGFLTWQLNEIWPTGGWGSLEYGTVGFTAGQVLGGRWRPLHHFMADHLFRDVISVCGEGGHCFVKNDGVAPFQGTVEVKALRISGAQAGSWSTLAELDVALPAGPGQSQWFTAEDWDSYMDGSFVFAVTVVSADGELQDRHVALPAPPSALKLSKPTLSFKIGDVDPADSTVPIVVSATGPALHVTLTTEAQGRFSQNSFLVPSAKEPVTLRFLPFDDEAIEVLRATLRIEDLASNMPAEAQVTV